MSLKKEIKVYHATGYLSYSDWIPGVVLVNNVEDADVVLFEGGEDINPALYGDSVGRHTYFNDRRDDLEVSVYKQALALGKACFGTCRGEQLLTAMAGGKLVQDMNHHRSHELTLYDGTKFYTNTLHHQMAYPYNLKKDEDYFMIAAAYGISDTFEDGSGKQMKMPLVDGKTEEPEFVFYPKINGLGIQGHPEMMGTGTEMVKLCRLFLELQLDGVLTNVLTLGIPTEELFLRTTNKSFEFTSEELTLLDNLVIKEEANEYVAD